MYLFYMIANIPVIVGSVVGSVAAIIAVLGVIAFVAFYMYKKKGKISNCNVRLIYVFLGRSL